MFNAKIKKTGKGASAKETLILELPLDNPEESSSGKMLMYATTRRFADLPVKVKGKYPLRLNLNLGVSMRDINRD